MLDSLSADLCVRDGVGQDAPILRAWFNRALPLCLGSEAFAATLDTARGFTPRPGVPAFSTALAVTGSHRLSLLSIHPAKPIPLHDHPGAWSAQIILSGRALIRHCDQEPQEAGSPGLACLHTVSEQELDVDAISTVGNEQRNIHSLAAIRDNAVLLSIQRTLYGQTDQSWFFPVDPPRAGQQLLLCHKIGKKRPISSAVRG